MAVLIEAPSQSLNESNAFLPICTTALHDVEGMLERSARISYSNVRGGVLDNQTIRGEPLSGGGFLFWPGSSGSKVFWCPFTPKNGNHTILHRSYIGHEVPDAI